eukprot:475796_1
MALNPNKNNPQILLPAEAESLKKKEKKKLKKEKAKQKKEKSKQQKISKEKFNKCHAKRSENFKLFSKAFGKFGKSGKNAAKGKQLQDLSIRAPISLTGYHKLAKLEGRLMVTPPYHLFIVEHDEKVGEVQKYDIGSDTLCHDHNFEGQNIAEMKEFEIKELDGTKIVINGLNVQMWAAQIAEVCEVVVELKKGRFDEAAQDQRDILLVEALKRSKQDQRRTTEIAIRDAEKEFGKLERLQEQRECQDAIDAVDAQQGGMDVDYVWIDPAPDGRSRSHAMEIPKARIEPYDDYLTRNAYVPPSIADYGSPQRPQQLGYYPGGYGYNSGDYLVSMLVLGCVLCMITLICLAMNVCVGALCFVLGKQPWFVQKRKPIESPSFDVHEEV